LGRRKAEHWNPTNLLRFQTIKEFPMSITAVKAKHQDGLVADIRSEVSEEASPLLRFLLSKAKFAAVGLLLIIAAVAGRHFYSTQAENQKLEEAEALGRILVISAPSLRLEKLEEFMAVAPASVRTAGWLAVMEAATLLQNNDKVYNAWKEIGAADPSLKVASAMGMAGALAARDKFREALDLLDAVSGGLEAGEAADVNSRIVILAELTGDLQRAVRACDAVTGLPSGSADMKFWAQKKLELQEKLDSRRENAD
jgi:predicted negative regulator of RcsB-dependent stress response